MRSRDFVVFEIECVITFLQQQHKPHARIWGMKYCTFRYRILYADGNACEGWSPYKGESTANSQLVAFVQKYFQELKTANQIFVSDIFEISHRDVWLAHVQSTVEFRFLKARGFMPDTA